MLRQERPAPSDDDGMFQGVPKLADIPQPRERRQEGRGGREDRHPGGFEAAEKMFGQRQNVLTPFAQGRQVNLEDVQAEEQIVAETAVGDAPFQVLMRRRQHAHIQSLRLIAAHRQDFVMFQDAEQFDLDRQGNVGQLIEENSAAIGQGEQAGPILGCSRKGAFDVAEQLAFDQAGIESGDVNGQEWPIATRAVTVHSASDQLLSGAAFAGDENAGIARRHQGDALEDHLHGRTGADDLFRPGDRTRGPGIGRRLVLKGTALQSTGHRFQGLIEIERLGQIIEGAAFDRPDRCAEIAESGHHDDGSILGQLPEPAQGTEAVEPRQADIEDDRIGPLLLGLFESFLGTRCDDDLVPLGRQRPLQRPTHCFFIIDDKDMTQSHAPLICRACV